MTELDYTGSRALSEALYDLDRRHIAFAIARAGEHMRQSLARSGLLTRIGEDRLFPSVDAVVTALWHETASSPPHPDRDDSRADRAPTFSPPI